jgi:opacity protein-like surface antigen
MTQLTKIFSGVVTATILTSSAASAKENFVEAGYASASVDGISRSGASVGFGVNFGETFKQSVGFKALFLGSDNKTNEDRGNIGDLSYTLGYEVLPNTIAYGSIGYGFQSLGSTTSTSSSSTSSAYAAGMVAGGGIKYNISESFAIDANYKSYSLSYETLDYDTKVTNVSLVYKFGKK